MGEGTTPAAPSAALADRSLAAAVRRASWAPAAAVALASAGIWLLSGVGARDIVVFAGFELVFLVLPGCLLYAALAPEDGPLRVLAFGWALGHVVGMLAYLAAVSAGERELFPVYPLVAVAVAAPVLLARRRAGAPLWAARVREERDAAWAWGMAGVAIVAIAAFALAVFPWTPLPGTVASASYLRDVIFQLSATAEVRHHWPLTDPKVAGVSVAYHTFPYMYMAGIDQVTGVGLPLAVFRFATVPLIALFVLQMGVAARAFTRVRWVGPLAVLLFLFISEIDLDSTNDTLPGYMPFYGGGPFVGLALSPTYAAGLVFFVPTVVLLAEWLGLVERARWGWGKWAALGLLLAGCAGAKAMILPVVLGGLVVYTALRWLRERRVDRRALVAIGAVAGVFLVFFLTLYGGAGLGETGAKLGIGGSTRWVYVFALAEYHIGSIVRLPDVVFALVLLLAAPLIGLLWYLRRGRGELRWRHGYLLSILVAALGPFVLLEQPFGNDLFFVSYGLVAASLVSAEGLARLWASERSDRRRARLVAVYGAVFLLALVVLWRVSYTLPLRAGWGYQRRFTVIDLSWLLFVAAVLVGLVLVARRSATVRPVLGRLVVVTVLVATALNIPIDTLPELRTRAAAGQPLHREGEVTPALYEGLAWIRDRTDTDAVLAVNKERSDAFLPWTVGHPNSPDEFYFTAFAERRVFLEGTVYTAEAFRVGVEAVEEGRAVAYPERHELNERLFTHGDPDALEELYGRYGVRYLVLDKSVAGATEFFVFRIENREAVRIRLPKVFSNAALDVYAVPPPATW